MAGSVNKAILVGNLTRDPEIRSTNSGQRIANLSVATSESWKDKASGERKERAEYHRVAIFNDGLVGVVEKFLKKGSKVYLEGSLQTRKWTGQDGKDNYSTEIVLQAFNSTLVMLDSPAGNGGAQRAPARPGIDPYAGSTPVRGAVPSLATTAGEMIDDDIPF